MTAPLWPAPREQRGSHVQHSWRCDRRATILETVRTDATGRRWVVAVCAGCDGSDLTWRMRIAKRGADNLTDDPKDAA